MCVVRAYVKWTLSASYGRCLYGNTITDQVATYVKRQNIWIKRKIYRLLPGCVTCSSKRVTHLTFQMVCVCTSRYFVMILRWKNMNITSQFQLITPSLKIFIKKDYYIKENENSFLRGKERKCYSSALRERHWYSAGDVQWILNRLSHCYVYILYSLLFAVLL